MQFERIKYENLNSKQKEIYNFQKCAALLANYGFNCIKLSDDWNGADFLALHISGATLRVQLKARLGIDKKYIHKGLHIAYPIGDTFAVVPHDKLIEIIREQSGWLDTSSWQNDGVYHTPSPSKALLAQLSGYSLNSDSFEAAL